MDSSLAVEGREFDWFFRDASGCIAILATNGSGPVLQPVLQAAAQHDAAAELIAVSGWGSPAVWQSYSAAGLFAYDWHESSGAYRRVAEPQGPLNPAVAAAVAGIPLAVLRGDFAREVEVRLGDLQHGT